jgi:hypothetical protein
MNTFGEQLLRRISLWTALCAALFLALPAVAAAQFMDPVLDQYAPSSQQIDKKVKGGDGGGGDSGGAGAGDAQVDPGTAVGADGQADGAGADDGAGAGAGAGGTGGDVGGGGGTGAGTGSGSGTSAGGDGGAATGSGSEGGSGLDARLLANVPLTWFDFLAFAIAIGVLIGTALVLRRLSHSPRAEA